MCNYWLHTLKSLQGWSNPYSTVPRKRSRRKSTESEGVTEEKPEAQSPLRSERLDLVRSISADNLDKIAKEETEVNEVKVQFLRQTLNTLHRAIDTMITSLQGEVVIVTCS